MGQEVIVMLILISVMMEVLFAVRMLFFPILVPTTIYYQIKNLVALIFEQLIRPTS